MSNTHSTHAIPVAESFLDRYARVTATGRYLPELDGLRFIAIAAVFLQHASQALANAFPRGAPQDRDLLLQYVGDSHFGVELFFIISGFILGLPFALHFLDGRPAVPLRAYFLRRLTRLEPPYVLSLVIFAVWAVAEGRAVTDVIVHFLAHLCYVHVLLFGQFHPGSLNPVTWSLEIEVQFYILAPLLARLFMLRPTALRRTSMIAVMVAAFAAKHLVQRAWPAFPPTLLDYLQYFLGGFIVVDLYVTNWHQLLSRHRAVDLVAIVGWLALPCLFLVHVPGTSVVVAIALTTLVAVSFQGSLIRDFLAHPVTRTLGGACYTIYLLHYKLLFGLAPFFAPLFTSASGVNSVLYALLSAIPILAICAQYFLRIEKPCMRRDWWKSSVRT